MTGWNCDNSLKDRVKGFKLICRIAESNLGHRNEKAGYVVGRVGP